MSKEMEKFGFSEGATSIARPCDSEIYLMRWKLFRVFGFEFKFHVFVSSDTMDPHNHPFGFMSIMLAGRYREYLGKQGKHYRDIKAPSIHFRRAGCIHRIEVDRPCLTFVVSTPRRNREWGFFRRRAVPGPPNPVHYSGGARRGGAGHLFRFIPWRKYERGEGICD